ncbi:hypothetical protein Droror1_Dr00004089 [Drosera rotundifolia]
MMAFCLKLLVFLLTFLVQGSHLMGLRSLRLNYCRRFLYFLLLFNYFDEASGPLHLITLARSIYSTAFSCLLQLTVWSPASEGAWKHTMAQLSQSIAFAITVVFVTLASRMEFSVCSVVKASVSCMDCGRGYDLSGIRVVMECNNGNKLATATTNKDGVFEAHLPLDLKPPIMVSICLVKLLGANEQFYALKKNMVSQIAMAEDNASVYTTATPLTVSKSCSSVGRSGKCRLQGHELSSSKTVDLPVPSVYGLPPTSFYAPLFPIIGIP